MVINVYPYEGYVIPGDDPVVPADVNGDGTLNVTDVTLLVDILLGAATIEDGMTPDVNGDGDLNITDLTSLIDMLLGANQ